MRDLQRSAGGRRQVDEPVDPTVEDVGRREVVVVDHVFLAGVAEAVGFPEVVQPQVPVEPLLEQLQVLVLVDQGLEAETVGPVELGKEG